MTKGLKQTEKERFERIEALTKELEAMLSPAHSITLEIGCGHGHFLTEYAQQHSDKISVGIDLLHNRIGRANKKKTRLTLRNLFFIKADAEEFLEALPRGIALESVFLLFPDPWPKNRHHKRRLIQPSFLTHLAERSLSNTPFFFRTDHKEYFDWVDSHLSEHPNWILNNNLSWPLEVSSVFQERMGAYQSLIAERV